MKYLPCFGIMGKTFDQKLDILFKIITRDAQTNSRFAAQAYLLKRYKEALKDTSKLNYGYIIINNSAANDCDDLRVTTNLFGEFPSLGPFPVCYTD